MNASSFHAEVLMLRTTFNWPARDKPAMHNGHYWGHMDGNKVFLLLGERKMAHACSRTNWKVPYREDKLESTMLRGQVVKYHAKRTNLKVPCQEDKLDSANVPRAKGQ